MDSGWVQLGVAIVPGAVAAWFAYRASSKAANSTETVAAQNAAIELHKLEIDRRRMDDEAVQRARVTYEQILVEMRSELDRVHKQVERVQDQYDRVARQLSTEQDVSNKLRNEVRQLQRQVDDLTAQIAVLESVAARLRTSADERFPPASTAASRPNPPAGGKA